MLNVKLTSLPLHSKRPWSKFTQATILFFLDFKYTLHSLNDYELDYSKTFQNALIDNIQENEKSIFSQNEIKSLNTPYFNIEEFRTPDPENSFSIIHINIRSINKNFEHFKSFYSKLGYMFDVICFTETWDDANVNLASNSNFQLPGYSIVSQARNNGLKGGGVALYVLKTHIF